MPDNKEKQASSNDGKRKGTTSSSVNDAKNGNNGTKKRPGKAGSDGEKGKVRDEEYWQVMNGCQSFGA